MDKRKKEEDKSVEVNFESHPPIKEDLDGIVTLLRQTLLNFIDPVPLAEYLIGLKDVTQVVALEGPEEEEENNSEDDEPDNNIYGVSSVIDLNVKNSDGSLEREAKQQLTRFLKERSAQIKTLLDTDNKIRLAFLINERYINLPPQLALSTFKSLVNHLDESNFTHLVLISKILLKSRNTDTRVPSKKVKSDSSTSKDAEPIVYINAEEEIIFEDCEASIDIDVSSQCDENASWSISSDTKYIPHRRIMLISYKKWLTIMKNLEKELN